MRALLRLVILRLERDVVTPSSLVLHEGHDMVIDKFIPAVESKETDNLGLRLTGHVVNVAPDQPELFAVPSGGLGKALYEQPDMAEPPQPRRSALARGLAATETMFLERRVVDQRGIGFSSRAPFRSVDEHNPIAVGIGQCHKFAAAGKVQFLNSRGTQRVDSVLQRASIFDGKGEPDKSVGLAPDRDINRFITAVRAHYQPIGRPLSRDKSKIGCKKRYAVKVADLKTDVMKSCRPHIPALRAFIHCLGATLCTHDLNLKN